MTGAVVAVVAVSPRSSAACATPTRSSTCGCSASRVFSSAALVSLLTGFAFAIAIVGAALFVDRVLYGGPDEQQVALGALAGATALGALRLGLRDPDPAAAARLARRAGRLGRGALRDGRLDLERGPDDGEPPSSPLFGLGFGLTVTPRSTAAVEAAGRRAFGAASATVTVARMIGMAIGLSVLAAYGSTVIAHLYDRVYGTPDGYKAFIPVELRDRPLKDGLVVDALESWAADEAAEVMTGLFIVAAGATLVAVPAALAWVAGRVCSGGRRPAPSARTPTSAGGIPEDGDGTDEARRSRSERAHAARDRRRSRSAHRAATRFADAPVLRIASLVDGKLVESEGTRAADDRARPARRDDLGRPHRRDRRRRSRRSRRVVGLHPLIAEDILEGNQRAKIEVTDDLIHIVLFAFEYTRPRRADRDRHRPRQGVPADGPRARVGPADGARPARRTRAGPCPRPGPPAVGTRRRRRRRLLPAPRPARRRDRGRPGARHRERPARRRSSACSRSRPSSS